MQNSWKTSLSRCGLFENSSLLCSVFGQKFPLPSDAKSVGLRVFCHMRDTERKNFQDLSAERCTVPSATKKLWQLADGEPYSWFRLILSFICSRLDIPLKTVQVGSSTAFDAVDSNRAISGELMASDERGYLDLITEQSLDSGVHNVSYEVEGRKPIQSVLYTIPKTAKFGIISDIDDTILVTEVPNLPAAVVNVFFKHPARRKAVAGMSEFYGKLSQLLPVSPFFYLSTSPWNVEAGIRDFIRIHDFPRGPLLLRDFDPRPKSFIPSGVQHKLEFADQLMSDFPDMRFILIGDDGQSDPSTYAKIAEKYPGRVAAIGIRRVSKKELAYFSFSRTFNSQNGKFFAGTDIPVFAGTDGKSLMDAMLPYLEKLTGSKAH